MSWPAPPLPSPEAERGSGIALVVGAGGSGSAAAVGAFRALERAGLTIDSITGSSSGGVVAAALALGWAPETIEAVLRRLWVPAVARGARHRAALRLAVPPRAPGFALREGSALDERVRRAFGEATFDDVTVPLRVVTTDLDSGERVVLEEGPIADAVRASLVVPVLLPPVRVGGRSLVDGALSEPLPLLLPATGAPRAVVALGFPCRPPRRAGPVLGAVLAAHAAAANNLLRLASAYQDLASPVPVLRLEPDLGGPAPLFDASGVPDAIEAGERAMEARLEELGRLLA